MIMMMAVIASLSMALVVYHHVVWPFLLRALARHSPHPPADPPARRYRACPGDRSLPSVTVVIPAFNEAAVIADKLHNLAALDYPSDRLRVIIACDGCSDATAALARTAAQAPICRDLAVEVREFPENSGKLAVLNEVVAGLDADVVALSDASALISADTLLIAAGHLADPRVGVVCATYRLLAAASQGEAAYWRYQIQLKEAEARLGAPLGAHGAFYMVRRKLFRPLPADTINDDFILPMSIVAAGYRAVYDSRMMALELEQSVPGQERRRRQRIAAGNLQQALRLRRLMLPRYRGVALAFASGKALRAVMPFLLVISCIGSLLLARSSIVFALAAKAQLLLYGLALLRHLLPGLRWPAPIETIHYVVSGHVAGLVGGTRYLLGVDRPAWGGMARRRHVHPLVALAKRAVDFGASGTLLLLTLPAWPLIALAIRLDSPGPIFFRQLRIGESRPDRTCLITILKFRTMRVEPVPRAVWAAVDDPRITRVGRFLRRSRLDELPQLWNVLKGEMSLVGPRPEQPGIVRWLAAEIPCYAERTYGVRPGITGLAQVSQGYDRTIDDVRSKLGFDHAYGIALGRPSVWLGLEFRIMFRTLAVMVQRAGQ